jgi:hypothetical protein
MKRHKYQALVTFDRQPDGSVASLPGPACRMVVCGHHHQTKASQFFSALISADGSAPPQPGGGSLITLHVLGDDCADYLEPGDHFELWRGSKIGHGVVSRRVFI